MLKNRPCSHANNIRTVSAFSDLRLFYKLIKLIKTTLWALKIFTLKLDPQYEFPRILDARDGLIKFVWSEMNILHPKSYTSDLRD